MTRRTERVVVVVAVPVALIGGFAFITPYEGPWR